MINKEQPMRIWKKKKKEEPFGGWEGQRGKVR